MADSKKPLFLVNYKDPIDNHLVSLKARSIHDSSLGLSFISISDFVFESNQFVIKPSEEQLQKKLENTKSLHISIYSIVSIEELSENKLKFENDKSKLLMFPNDSKPTTH